MLVVGQAKAYAVDRPVGVGAVCELVGTVAMFQFHHAAYEVPFERHLCDPILAVLMTKKRNLENYRPVGCTAVSTLAAMSKVELEERRETVARLRELTKKAEKGDKKVLLELRGILNGSPELAWHLVNLGKTAECLLIDKLTKKKDLAGREIIERQLELMREEVAGESASPLERLLAERVVMTWLQLQLFEALYSTSLGNLNLSQGNYHQKRLDRAHRNHLSAIRTLAQIRKLAPAVQINIAEKQINQAR